jgi:hypothetical protein
MALWDLQRGVVLISARCGQFRAQRHAATQRISAAQKIGRRSGRHERTVAAMDSPIRKIEKVRQRMRDSGADRCRPEAAVDSIEITAKTESTRRERESLNLFKH